MLFKSIFFRVLGVLCLTFSLSVAAFADTIRLKDGSIIKGKIVSFGDGKFIVMVGSRQMDFSARDVESIQFDAAPATTAANVKTSASTTATDTEKTSIVSKVGQNQNQVNPPTSAPKINGNQTAAFPKPIEINVKVLADNTANGWSNSGWVVRKGQRIKISGGGRISLGGGRYATPGGIASLPDKDKLMARESTGGLIAVIGDNNNDFIFIGDSKEFVASRDGALFLGVNEGNLDDNSGAFDVKIEIDPNLGN